MTTVVFYDLTTNKGALSPFAWRVRLALNYKRIAYKTHWLTFTEIEPHLKSIGAPPSGKRPDTGADLYTLPALSIEGTFVVDSAAIVEHLERAFPEAPTLFPAGTRALQEAFIEFFSSQVILPTAQVLVPGLPALLDPANAQYFRETRTAWYGGTPLDEWAPLGSQKRADGWKEAQGRWGTLAAVYRKSEGPNVWLTGSEPVYADLVVLAMLVMMPKVAPEDEWNTVLEWHGGPWNKLWQAGQRYMLVE